jgi:1-deoxy-D-xylulose-5-phosphate reductoisomerase
MVEFCDGSVIAQLSQPDMKMPIQYALTWPKRRSGGSLSVDWSKQQSLDFEPINCARYPAVRLAFDVMNQGGTSGAVFNAANEVVVEAFLEQSLPFGSMIAIVEEVLGSISISNHVTFDSVVKADSEARKQASALVASHKVNS